MAAKKGKKSKSPKGKGKKGKVDKKGKKGKEKELSQKEKDALERAAAAEAARKLDSENKKRSEHLALSGAILTEQEKVVFAYDQEEREKKEASFLRA